MKKLLDEVTLLRPFNIFLLVMMHCFTMYAGYWRLPEGIENVRAYFWVQKFTYAAMLESFMFISGYVFAYQLFECKREYTFKRLMIPSLLISVLYVIVFPYPSGTAIGKIIGKCITGAGHLWFLPILFLCFLVTFGIQKIKVKDVYLMAFLFVLAVVIPMTRYLYFFNLAFYIWKRRDAIKGKFVNGKIIISGGLLFLVSFIPMTLWTEDLLELVKEDQFAEYKLLFSALRHLFVVIYSTIGTLWCYIVALYLKQRVTIPSWLLKLNGLCMGIYIVHQFILKLLLYNSPLPQVLGTYWLPWICFVIVIVSSILLAYLLRLTRLGRALV